jgi:hypothetical protein
VLVFISVFLVSFAYCMLCGFFVYLCFFLIIVGLCLYIRLSLPRECLCSFEMHACALETAAPLIDHLPFFQLFVVVDPFQFCSYYWMDLNSQSCYLGNCLLLLLSSPFDSCVFHWDVYSCVAISSCLCLYILISHQYLLLLDTLGVYSSCLPWLLLVFEEVSYSALVLRSSS